MEQAKLPWSRHVANLARAVFWLALLAIVLAQVLAPRALERSRAALLGRLEDERKSRVIAMIHRQESASILGVPVAGSISIDDSEAVLRAIRLTPPEQPIDVILHTPGGRVVIVDFMLDSEVGPPPRARVPPSRVRTELARAGYKLTEELTFLPNQYFLVFSAAQ